MTPRALVALTNTAARLADWALRSFAASQPPQGAVPFRTVAQPERPSKMPCTRRNCEVCKALKSLPWGAEER